EMHFRVERRRERGCRHSSRHDVHRLLFIRRARALGLSLAHLKALTAELDSGECLMGALVKRGQSTLPAFGTLGTFGACHVPGPLQTDGLPLCSLAQSVASAMCPSTPRS